MSDFQAWVLSVALFAVGMLSAYAAYRAVRNLKAHIASKDDEIASLEWDLVYARAAIQKLSLDGELQRQRHNIASKRDRDWRVGSTGTGEA